MKSTLRILSSVAAVLGAPPLLEKPSKGRDSKKCWKSWSDPTAPRRETCRERKARLDKARSSK